jgi:hypothetical protein
VVSWEKKGEKREDDQPTFWREAAPARPYRYRDHGGDYRPRVKNLSTKAGKSPARATLIER